MAKTKYDIEVKFHSNIDTAEMAKYTEEDIDRLLTKIPKAKYHQGVAALKALEERERASDNYKLVLAKTRLLASNMKETLGLGSDKDREAWAVTQEAVIAARSVEIDAIIKVKLEDYKYVYLDDEFTSVRKMANKIEKLLDAQMQTAKYGRR